MNTAMYKALMKTTTNPDFFLNNMTEKEKKTLKSVRSALKLIVNTKLGPGTVGAVRYLSLGLLDVFHLDNHYDLPVITDIKYLNGKIMNEQMSEILGEIEDIFGERAGYMYIEISKLILDLIVPE